VSTLILEAAPALPDEPRAVGLDPETLRTLQSLDMLEQLEGDILHGMTGEYLNGEGELLFTLTDEAPGPLGYTSLASFHQPSLVTKLAVALERYPSLDLCFEHTLESLEQDESGVDAVVKMPDGSTSTFRADYLVGCDGGRSTTRHLLGITMQGESNPQPWLVIDTREEESTVKNRYRFYCDPRRPGMFLQTPHNTRRWEWMLMPGEDREAFLEDEQIDALLTPHIDTSKIEVFRRRVYDFHAILAEHFQKGRAFIAGDAAHMTPPFAGQGLNSGLRDVTNLGWKLAAVLKAGAPDCLLDSYQAERWDHAKEVIDLALILGDQIQPIDPGAAEARDAMFAELNQQPEAMAQFVDSILQGLLNRYFLKGSAVGIGEEYLVGRMISQPAVIDAGGRSALLDNYLGEGFAILGYNCDPEQELGESLVGQWRERGLVFVGIDDTGSNSGLALEADSHLAGLFSQGRANMVLLRPDRFCMAAFDANSARETLAQAGELLGYQQEL
jgi:3-(3-hydroxy-phenyl)propionate hydroxylase